MYKLELVKLKLVLGCLKSAVCAYDHRFIDSSFSLFDWKVFHQIEEYGKKHIVFIGRVSGLDTQKIGKVIGKRFKVWAMLFLFGSIIDFIKLGAGITIASTAFLLIPHLIDMTINRNRKYRI